MARPSLEMRRLAALAAALVSASCAISPVGIAPIGDGDIRAAAASIESTGLLRNIGTLSSDDFEGRSPGTHGESVTIDYIAREFAARGVAPGAANGSFFQQVPLVEFHSHPALALERAGRAIPLRTPDDFVAWAPRREADVVIANSGIVFVGYGVVAPEYGWNDFKGVDVRGKTIVMLVNDPQVPDPADPSRLDDTMFKGRAMTYYGRWTYKYEQAQRVGAAAALIVHETIPASYPYSVVVNSMGRENYELASAGRAYPPVAGWIPVDQARALFAASGLDFEVMKEKALRKDFRPVPLGSTANFRVHNDWREIPSHNVIARIEGSDPALKDEAVVYTAHWDHFGWDASLPGPKSRQVYHGALDNASGISALLAIARAYKALPRAPRRSIVFVATTAEERGLLGSTHYVDNPVVPLRRTLANINIDGINLWGRTRDVVIVGLGQSTLDEIITSVAAKQGRKTTPEAHPETGGFFRSDQLPFIRAGVPAAYFGSGSDFIGRPPGFSEEKRNAYVANRYHKVADVVDPEWDFAGALEDLRMAFEVGLRVAEGDDYPAWRPDSEFKAKRDAMMR